MKNKRNGLLTTALFLIIIGLGYYIIPVILHFSVPTTLLNKEVEVTEEYTLHSTSVSSRVFEPLKKRTMQIPLSSEELSEIRDTATYWNVTEENFPWLFNENATFYKPDELDSYTYSSECVAIIESNNQITSYVFDPYIFYVLESVHRPLANPTPAQIAAAYDKLTYDTNLSSEKLTNYLNYITSISDIDSYDNTSYLSNSLYYSMYINQPNQSSDNTIANYNYTLSYSLLDCITLGEKTVQFDGTLFAITYFVDQYGLILYYDPTIQDYCGYTIIDA